MNKVKSYFPTGIITAAVTPMDKDLNADTNLLVTHCRNLLTQGSDGIVLLGTTGEANSFSVNERKGILEDALEGGLAPQLLMVGTGCCAITDTVALTRHALDLGVTNILMLPPFYYKPVTDEALFNYFSRVIETIADDRLHIYLYHFPKNTGIDLTIRLISKLLERYSDTIVGIKDSGGDWNHMQKLMHEFPSFRLFSGTEEYLLETLKAGGVGCISATANLTVANAAKVIYDFHNGKDADKSQRLLTAMRNVFSGYPFVGAVKGYLAIESKIPSWNYLRPPNEVLDEDVVSLFVKKVQHLKSKSFSRQA